MVSALFEKWKRAKNVKKVESKLGPRLRQTWSKYVAQHNWTKFWLKNGNFCLLFILRFCLKNLILPAGRKIFLINKKLTCTKFWLKKRLFSDQIMTLQHIYIYIYLYILGPGGIALCFTIAATHLSSPSERPYGSEWGSAREVLSRLFRVSCIAL